MRVCVYASSSPKTSSAFVAQGRRLGRLLAERGHVLWSNGAFRGGAVAGVTGAALAADDAGVLVVEHGSGRYSFTRVGTE